MDAIELTRKLVAIKSMNSSGDEHDCALLLGELLADHGFPGAMLEVAEPAESQLLPDLFRSKGGEE